LLFYFSFLTLFVVLFLDTVSLDGAFGVLFILFLDLCLAFYFFFLVGLFSFCLFGLTCCFLFFGLFFSLVFVALELANVHLADQSGNVLIVLIAWLSFGNRHLL